jgi:plasmid replication initiation protein
LDEVFFNIESLGYIRYRLKHTVKLQSKYDIKLYLFFKLYEYNKPCTFNIQLSELKEKIECTQKSYNKYFLFNQKVLAPSVQRINSFTDINVEYKKPYGEDYIEFIVRKKTKEELQKQEELEQLEQKTTEELQQTEQPIEEPTTQILPNEIESPYNLPMAVLEDAEQEDIDILVNLIEGVYSNADIDKCNDVFKRVNVQCTFPKDTKSYYKYYRSILKLVLEKELSNQQQAKEQKEQSEQNTHKTDFHNFEERNTDYDAILRRLNNI